MISLSEGLVKTQRHGHMAQREEGHMKNTGKNRNDVSQDKECQKILVITTKNLEETKNMLIRAFRGKALVTP